jgi:hypothetical protein
MMALEQRSFQKSDPLFAFRSFVAHGRRFNRGAAFDWQALGIAAEKVELLFRAGKVRHYQPGNLEIDLSENGLGEKLADDVPDPAPVKKVRAKRVLA